MIKALIILLLGTLSGYSQAPGGLVQPALWIEGSSDLTAKKIDTSKYFNFNPKYNGIKAKNNKHKNILTNQYSIFMAFKSNEKAEIPIALLQLGTDVTTITNLKVETDKSLEYKKVNSKNGIVLSYFVSKQHLGKKKTNTLSFENINDNIEGQSGHDLLEVAYYPRILNVLEKKKVETYLSIKYGISLLGNSDYIDSDNNKIWNSEKNSSYSMRITGIGRNDASGLNQKQSGNSEKDGLCVGYNEIAITNRSNTSVVPDKSFLLWGDNGGSTSLKRNKKETGISKMKRIWKLQCSGEQLDSVSAAIKISKKEMQLGGISKSTKDESIWLAISPTASGKFDYTNASYFLQYAEIDDSILFNAIHWDADKNGEDLFTFIKAPAFFATYDITGPNCALAQNGKIKLKTIGGQAPYSIKLQSGNYSKNMTTIEDTIEFSDLLSGSYQILVSDSRLRTYTDVLTIAPISETALSIASEWYLDNNGETEMFPISETASKFTYEWYMEDRLVSKEEKFIATQAGNYKLLAKSEEGCFKEFLLKVNEQQDLSSGNWMLYPNPVKTDEPFTVHFELKESSDAEIAIYEMGGKLLKTNILYSIKDGDYKDSLGFTGTYLIVVTIQGKSKAIKLIVR